MRVVGSSAAEAPEVGTVFHPAFHARIMIEQMPAIVWTVDRDLRFTSMAGAGLAHIGLTAADFVGATIADVIRRLGVGRGVDEAHTRALAGKESRYETEVKGRCYDAFLQPLHADDGAIVGVIGVALDISERRSAEAALRRSLERASALSAITRALTDAQRSDDVLDAAARQIVSLVGHLCVIALQAEDGWIEPAAVHHRDPAIVATVRSVMVPAAAFTGWVRDALVARAPIVLDQVKLDDFAAFLDPEKRSALEGLDLGSLVAVPLRARERTLGLMILVRSDRPYDDDEVSFAVDLADRVSLAIDASQMHARTRRQLEQVQVLHAIDLAIASAHDLRSTLEVLVDRSVGAVGVDALAIHLVTADRTLVYAAGRGFRTAALTAIRIDAADGYLGRAVATQRTQVVTDVLADGSVLRRSALAREGIVSVRAVPLIANGLVCGVLEACRRSAGDLPRDDARFLEALAAQAGVALRNAELFEDLQRTNTELAIAYDTTLEGWSRALDLRDEETEGHTRRVTEVTVRLARSMGIDGDVLVHMRRGALLHDIGKMAVPDAILQKPGPLTPAEWRIMRRHPGSARDLLQPIPYLRDALDIPFFHHERWDGSGYPNGLSGTEIPVSARIFAVADIYDALRSDRPYRRAWPEERVRAYLSEQAGLTLDPEPVRAFLALDAMTA